MLSRWGMKGKLTCPHCMDDTKAFTLRHGGKTTWFDYHRRFLSKDHNFRKTQRSFTKNKVELDDPPCLFNVDQIWQYVHNFPKVTNGPFGMLPWYTKFHN